MCDCAAWVFLFFFLTRYSLVLYVGLYKFHFFIIHCQIYNENGICLIVEWIAFITMYLFPAWLKSNFQIDLREHELRKLKICTHTHSLLHRAWIKETQSLHVQTHTLPSSTEPRGSLSSPIQMWAPVQVLCLCIHTCVIYGVVFPGILEKGSWCSAFIHIYKYPNCQDPINCK